MRILVADDDAASRWMLERTLQKWGYEVVSAADGAEAWTLLEEENGPKLAILDWMMPALDGPEVCRRVRERLAGRYTYCLLLTGKSRPENLVAGLEAGADDFLVKPFDAYELRARLRAAQRILDLEEALRVQATRDALTGLLNRGAAVELLERELHRARRQRRPTSIVLADLDRFKAVNDGFGHLAGDAVLRETASRMRAAVRAYDGVGRFGGEEFLIVLPGCPVAAAVALAERVRASVAGGPVETEDGPIAVTVSLGVAACASEDPTSEGRSLPPVDRAASALLRAADSALYAAKAAGRDAVASADGRLVAGRPEAAGGAAERQQRTAGAPALEELAPARLADTVFEA